MGPDVPLGPEMIISGPFIGHFDSIDESSPMVGIFVVFLCSKVLANTAIKKI